MNENDGYIILMELVQAARADKPYKHLIEELRPYVEQFQGIAALVIRMQESVGRDLTKYQTTD